MTENQPEPIEIIAPPLALLGATAEPPVTEESQT